MDKFQTFDADIIVIGSGIGTQAFMHQFKNPESKILVLEGGDLGFTKFGDSLTLSDERGHFVNNHWGMHWSRVYGGASRIWNGWSSPLERWDLIGIDGRPKWPITIEELEKYYRLSAPLLGEDPSVANLVNYDTKQLFVNRPFILTNPLSYTDATKLTSRKNIELRLKHNVIRFTSDTNTTHINGIWYSVDGVVKYAKVKPNTKIILGAGGLGNAQILLQPSEKNQKPIGNESGLVGKFLMAHPHVPAGEAFVDASVVAKPAWGNVNYKNWMPTYILGDTYKTKLNLLNCSLSVGLDKEVKLQPHQLAVQRFYEKKWGKPLAYKELYARSEQLPNPENRIEIVAEKNAAGIHKLKTYCVFGARDMMSIDTTTRMFGDYLINSKLGVITVDNDSIFLRIWGWAHPSGITRLGTSIKNSVCDSNCRVHSYQNLYLVGSSLFPTVGYANPTWTIASLGMRLADHITEQLKNAS